MRNWRPKTRFQCIYPITAVGLREHSETSTQRSIFTSPINLIPMYYISWDWQPGRRGSEFFSWARAASLSEFGLPFA
jgi:hypothetical protein